MNLPFLPSEFSAEGSPVQVVNIHPVLCWQDSSISVPCSAAEELLH